MCSSNIMTGAHAYARDSFDRFGDDLCGLILDFLKPNDSEKLLCVSKQWKRTIYQNVRSICLVDTNDYNYCNSRRNGFRYSTANLNSSHLLLIGDRLSHIRKLEYNLSFKLDSKVLSKFSKLSEISIYWNTDFHFGNTALKLHIMYLDLPKTLKTIVFQDIIPFNTKNELQRFFYKFGKILKGMIAYICINAMDEFCKQIKHLPVLHSLDIKYTFMNEKQCLDILSNRNIKSLKVNFAALINVEKIVNLTYDRNISICFEFPNNDQIMIKNMCPNLHHNIRTLTRCLKLPRQFVPWTGDTKCVYIKQYNLMYMNANEFGLEAMNWNMFNNCEVLYIKNGLPHVKNIMAKVAKAKKLRYIIFNENQASIYNYEQLQKFVKMYGNQSAKEDNKNIKFYLTVTKLSDQFIINRLNNLNVYHYKAVKDPKTGISNYDFFEILKPK